MTPIPTVGGRSLVRDLTILLALVAVVYANSFRAGFTLDNDFFILGDERVHAASAANVRRILSEDYTAPRFVTGVYRPLTTLSFLFNYAVLGGADDPVGYHLLNLLLHFGNTVLVYLLALAIVADAWSALFVAALFAAHPIATEAVTNMVGRGDLLAAGSVLAGMLMYLRSIDARGWTRVAWLGALACSTMIGLLAKESAVAILGAMLAYDLVYRLRWAPREGLRPLLQRMGCFFRDGYVALVPPFVALLIIRAAVYRDVRIRATPFLENPLVAADTVTRVLTAVKVMGMYAERLVWPAYLSCDYSYDAIPLVQSPPTSWEDWHAWIVLAALSAAIVVVVRQRRRNPPLAFFALFAFLTFLPTSNLPLVIGTIMGERLAYLPLIGFAGSLVVGVTGLARRFAGTGRDADAARRVVAGVFLALVVAGYGVRTVVRNRDWHDTLTLFESATRAAPGSFKVHKLYAAALAEADPGLTQLERVIAEEERALAIIDRSTVPAEARSWTLLQSLGEHVATRGQRLGATSAEGHALLVRSAGLLAQAADVNRMKEETDRLRILGGSAAQGSARVGTASIYDSLGRVRLELREYDAAAAAFREVARVAPDDPDAQIGLARVHLGRGELEKAAFRLVVALVLDGNRRDAVRMLVDVYRQSDPTGCALKPQGSEAPFDWTCPSVQATLCAADAELIVSFVAANERATADKVARNAVANHQCAPDVLPPP